MDSLLLGNAENEKEETERLDNPAMPGALEVTL